MIVRLGKRWRLGVVLYRLYSNESNGDRFIYLQKALANYKDTGFIPFQANVFQLGQCFTDSSMRVVQYLRDSSGVIREPESVRIEDLEKGIVKSHVIPFKSLFYNGFEALRSRVDNSNNINPELSLATEYLVNGFLHQLRFHERCLHSVLETDRESAISVVLANHLFSSLTSTKRYYVTKDTDHKPVECPCALKCGEKIQFDQTGIGSELLWYGRPDIMIFPTNGGNCGIVVPGEVDENDETSMQLSPEERRKQLIEVKSDNSLLRNEKNVRQITSMAITFSMYQNMFLKRKNKGKPPILTLIPLIAARATSFDIYLYDSKHDILLRNVGQPIPLWEDDLAVYPKLNLSSVLKLWMVVNHMAVVPYLIEQDIALLSGSCGFLSKLSDTFKEAIEGTLKMAGTFRPKKPKEFDIHFFTLSPHS